MAKIIIIDNYDSFTYNVLHYLAEVANEQCEIEIIRNDACTVSDIAAMRPSHLIISPGPCTPDDAGISIAVAQQLGPQIPLLGICLGHQAVAQAFGAKIIRAKSAMHGKICEITHNNQSIFESLPSPLTVTRYHSLAIELSSCPECIEVLAEAEDGEIMAIRHRQLPSILGVQFHPEAILTAHGKDLLKNFLSL